MSIFWLVLGMVAFFHLLLAVGVYFGLGFLRLDGLIPGMAARAGRLALIAAVIGAASSLTALFIRSRVEDQACWEDIVINDPHVGPIASTSTVLLIATWCIAITSVVMTVFVPWLRRASETSSRAEGVYLAVGTFVGTGAIANLVFIPLALHALLVWADAATFC